MMKGKPRFTSIAGRRQKWRKCYLLRGYYLLEKETFGDLRNLVLTKLLTAAQCEGESRKA